MKQCASLSLPHRNVAQAEWLPDFHVGDLLRWEAKFYFIWFKSIWFNLNGSSLNVAAQYFKWGMYSTIFSAKGPLSVAYKRGGTQKQIHISQAFWYFRAPFHGIKKCGAYIMRCSYFWISKIVRPSSVTCKKAGHTKWPTYIPGYLIFQGPLQLHKKRPSI